MDKGMMEGMNDMGAPAAPAADAGEGYCIKIYVRPDGSYTVRGPEPMEDEPDEGTPFETIGEALKEVLSIIKANPPVNDAQKQLEAGYAAG